MVSKHDLALKCLCKQLCFDGRPIRRFAFEYRVPHGVSIVFQQHIMPKVVICSSFDAFSNEMSYCKRPFLVSRYITYYEDDSRIEYLTRAGRLLGCFPMDSSSRLRLLVRAA